MALQTQTLVDGLWTTQTMDFRTILERNKELLGQHKTLPEPSDGPPTIGLLTQTIIPSPVIKQIIQARIRGKQNNDVLFIGENYIQIRELLDGHLQDIARKADFGSRIRHAAVLGSPRKPESPAISDIKEDLDIDMDYGSNILNLAPAQERGFGWRELPPNILILTLECGDLIFLFANQQGENTDFIIYRKPLVAMKALLEVPGNIIAVDPRSRAIAVSAWKNTFSIYSLHTIDKIASDVESNDGFISSKFNPIKEERHFNLGLEAVIHKMDFIYPDPKDEEHITLVLIFFRDQQTLLTVYHWDSSQSLRSITHPGPPTSLTRENRLPLLMIPLTISPIFFIVSEDHISIYSNFLSTGLTRALTLSIPHENRSPFHNGKGAPLWTAWTRPVRTDKYSSAKDCVYIGREDGLLNYLEMDQDQIPLTPNILKLGSLDCNIDTAFASLDLGVDRDDMLISGGDMSAGALYIVKPRKSPVYIEEVPNWTSVVDFAIKRPQGEVTSRYNSDRIFACTGIQKQGCVSEIRFGLQARIGTTITYLPGITSIWSLPEHRQTGLLFLFAFPEHSTLFYVPFKNGGPRDISMDVCGLDLASRTLAVTTRGLYIIQVTEKSIRATVYSPEQHYSIMPEISFTGEKIVLAAIDEASSIIALTVYKDGASQLKLAQFNLQEGNCSLRWIGNQIPFTSDPSCLLITKMPEYHMVALGTVDSLLHIYELDGNFNLIASLDFNISEQSSSTVFSICESMAVLGNSSPECFPSDNCVMLLCGLRDGILLTFNLKNTEKISLELRDSAKIGETAVTITVDSQKTNGAMITCGKEICHYELRPNRYIETFMQRIYLTDKNDASLHGILVEALSRIQPQPHVVTAGYSNSFLCVTGNELIIAELDKIPRTIPRRISIDGTPRRILYSDRLKLLIVASAQHSRESHFLKGYPDLKLNVRPFLAFIDPDKECLGPNINRTEPYEIINSNGEAKLGEVGETVFALTEWDYDAGGKRFSFLLIGTGEIKSHDTESCNRVLFYEVKRRPEGGVILNQRYVLKFAKPVYSIAVYNSSTLLFGYGDCLSIQQLSFQTKKFKKIDKFQLQSNAIHITVEDEKIYCSTKHDSLISFKFENGKLNPQFGDRIARSSSHHLVLSGSNVTLVTDADCGIAGLWQPKTLRNEAATTTVFAADIPVSITRLRYANITPTWRSRFPVSQAPYSDSPAIIGSCIDGSFYGITILPERTWRLLRLIQNVAVRSYLICPIGSIGNPRPHIEPSSKVEAMMHVNGDILRCVLDLGPEWFEQLLLEDPDPEHGDFVSAKARFDRFREIANELFGQSSVKREVSLAFAFLEGILQPML